MVRNIVRIILVAVFLILATPGVVSACEKPVYVLQAGETAPCKGYLMSPSAYEEALANKTVSIPLLESKLKLLSEDRDLLISQVQQWKSYSEDSKKAQHWRDLEKVIWFFGGSIITGLVAKEVLE